MGCPSTHPKLNVTPTATPAPCSLHPRQPAENSHLWDQPHTHTCTHAARSRANCRRQVDVILNGHVHSYERTKPIVNSKVRDTGGSARPTHAAPRAWPLMR